MVIVNTCAQNNRRSYSLVEGPQDFYSYMCFMARMSEGGPERPPLSLLQHYKSQRSWEQGPDASGQGAGTRPARAGHSAPKSCREFTVYPKSSLCSPHKSRKEHIYLPHSGGQSEFVRFFFLFVSYLGKESSFLYFELPSLESLRANTSRFPDFPLDGRGPRSTSFPEGRGLETCGGPDRDFLGEPDQFAPLFISHKLNFRGCGYGY